MAPTNNMKSVVAGIQSVLALLQAESGQLVEPCGPTGVVCVQNHAAVLPYHFERSSEEPATLALESAQVYEKDVSWDLIKNASFVVFDREVGLEILGSNPSVEVMFKVSPDVHEAPVYLPEQNKLIFAELAEGQLPLFQVDLDKEPPVLSEFTPDPPIYVPNGAYISDGIVWFGASGGNHTQSGQEFKPSLQTWDPRTNEAKVWLNNYYGYYFNTIDDLAVHPITKDVWFTDPDYSWYTGIADTAPQMPTATWRFDPKTGATYMIDEELYQPDGIGFSPDGKILYLGDSGAYSGSNDPRDRGKKDTWDPTGRRTIYAYDLSDDFKYILNKRVFYMAGNGATDGVRCARNGFVVTATGAGIDVVDTTGRLVLRVQLPFNCQNFIWTGKDYETIWATGNGAIARIEMKLPGQKLK